MTTPIPQPARDAHSARDALLARLIDELVEQSHRGERLDLDAVVSAHPDLADELRQLWATVMIAEDCASFADDAGTITTADPVLQTRRDVGSSTRLDLPRRLGDFELIQELGRGGMGVVYKARQISLGRIVALKMLLRGEWASDADLARFRAEALSAARLDHPNIVPVHEVGDVDGQPYFSMRYVEGTTLTQRMADGPLAAREIARLLVPVCQAVAHAHQHGLLHRDLKPANILMDCDGRPVVTDFGLAKRWTAADAEVDDADPDAKSITELTQSGALLGTPGYMAPEQAAGRHGHLGPGTDVYGLGAVLYALLTGRPPFQAPSPLSTVLLVLEQDPLPPRLLNPGTDPDLEMIALKCLQKPIDLRYASVSELAKDLEAYLAGNPVSARSGRFSDIMGRMLRETHHAAVLENWGLLWMWHALVLLVLCLVTNLCQWAGVDSRIPYVGLWSVGLGIWAAIFWNLRRRSGPITFVERQIAHLWGGSMISSTLLFAMEALLGLPVLSLSPVLGLIGGAVFLAKGGILAGRFYIQAGALFAMAVVMAVLEQPGYPRVGITLFGLVSAACFFVPGLKYYRQRVRATR